MIGDDFMRSWQEGHKTVELLLDGVMNVLKDREISDKIPVFSVISTIATIKSSINFKDFTHDMRKDDMYIKAEDGEEMPPPPQDNISTSRKVNNPDVLAKHS